SLPAATAARYGGGAISGQQPMLRLTASCALAFTLGACSVTLPVQGQAEDGSEIFSGTATGYLDRSGDLAVTTSKGATCKGDFIYVSAREGEGVFRCADGRSGPFHFVSTGQHGTGQGKLADKPFTFTFGR